MTNDRKPALTRYFSSSVGMVSDDKGAYIFASDLPPAILALTKPELAALAVFAEAMPELLLSYIQPTRADGEPLTKFQGYPSTEPAHVLLVEVMDAALAAAKDTK